MKLFILLISPLIFSTAFGEGNANKAGQGKIMGAISAVTNNGVGVMMMSQCAPPTSIMPCILGALSFLQSSESGRAKQAAARTQAGYQSSGGYDDSRLAYDDFSSPDSAFAPFKDDLAQLGIKDEAGLYRYNEKKLAELNKLGVKINDKDGTITGPDGKKFSMSSLSSAQGMLDAGIPKEQIDQLEKLAKSVTDKYKVVSVGLASGGGGGGGGGSSSSSNHSNYRDPFASLYGLDREKPQAARTAGLSRTLASGESIGTQTDSIFEMISRNYKKKSEENIFVKTD